MRRFAVLAVPYLLCAIRVSAADFYVDPAQGDPGNDGSAQHPWKSLQQVLDAGLVETSDWESLPYASGKQLEPKHAGAPVKPGDTIWLRSGDYGNLTLRSHYNTSQITVAAQAGHTPRFHKILVQSCANWLLKGLTVRPDYAADGKPNNLVELDSDGYRGPIDHVTVEDCAVSSAEDSSGWSKQDWNDRASNGIRVEGDAMTVRGNDFKNVNFGIIATATHSLIDRNTIENFSGDGMVGLGDYTVYQYNTVKNCYAVNANHDDGFQSWSSGPGGVGTGEVKGVTLRGNTIINYENPAQPYRGALQGIGCFDGTYVDWVVENNLVLVNHWHGITLMGARGCRIVNNTVADLNNQSPGPPWVAINKHKNGTASTDCVIRNNLTTDVQYDSGQDVAVDHNMLIGNPSALFRNAAGFDMHLIEGSPAIDAGSSELAPAADHDGAPRPQGEGVDVGAFEYHADSLSVGPLWRAYS